MATNLRIKALRFFSENTDYPVLDQRVRILRNGAYPPRPGDLLSIAIHHSLTKTGSAAAFARYHVNDLGWPGIGYTYVIRKDGTVEWCHPEHLKTYHVGKSNPRSLGICLVGDFRVETPEAEQYDALRWLILDVLNRHTTIHTIQGHSSFPGYSWKECPCFDVEDFLLAYGIKEFPDAGYNLTPRYRQPS